MRVIYLRTGLTQHNFVYHFVFGLATIFFPLIMPFFYYIKHSTLFILMPTVKKTPI